MHKHLITSIDYKRLIEMQASNSSYVMNKKSSSKNLNTTGSKKKIKSLGVRK